MRLGGGGMISDCYGMGERRRGLSRESSFLSILILYIEGV